MFSNRCSLFAAAVLAACAVPGRVSLGARQSTAPADCAQFLVAQKEVDGKRVGHESCRMIEADVTLHGRTYRRVDVGISGTIAGHTATSGPRAAYFTEAPDFVFPQVGNTSPLKRGIARYSAENGTAVIVVYPDRAVWNGKMYLTAHGGSRSLKRGNLKPWDKNLDPANPARDLSKYEQLMLEKGYAVAKTRRTTDPSVGDATVMLDDGTTLNRNLTELPSLLIGFAEVAENLLQARLGRKPSHTYWYGRSAGARPGRLVNYAAGINAGSDGKPFIDGILADDSGAGLWLPVVYRDGQDTLFTTDAERARFVPQIDISHLLYVNETDDSPPAWVSRNYLENKRRNAKILGDKGLGSKFRVYEVHGISHIAGEDDEVSPGGESEFLDTTRIMESFIDLLDAWVTKGAQPPPSRSDWAEIGDADRDGVVENAGIALPEVACPLGLFYQYPAGAGPNSGTATGFARFKGSGLEPLDGRGIFVDMNLNRYRDRVEAVDAAWRRLGLLGPKEPFTAPKYAACVTSTAARLHEQRFISKRVLDVYVKEAQNFSVPTP